MIGAPLLGLKVVLEDGAYHEVDSSELAFMFAAQGAFREVWPELDGKITEPWMNIEVMVPVEFEQVVSTGLMTRMCQVMSVEKDQMGANCTIKAYGPLDGMFGYVTFLRSQTQGRGEFTMEYADHQIVMRQKQEELIEDFYLKKKHGGEKFSR